MRWSHLQRCVAAAAVAGACLAAPAVASAPVATVTGPAGTAIVSEADMTHWRRIARATSGSSSVPQRQIDRQVLQLLLSFAWIQGEANEQGVTVTDAEVRQSFDEQRGQSFPKLADYRRFLRQSHQTDADILQRVRLDLLSSRIRDRVEASAPPVTEADVDARVQSAGPQTVPQERDIRLIETQTRRGALRAKARVHRHGIDRGEERDFLLEDHGLALARAVFRAPRGQIMGPVRSEGDYFVFEVVRVHPRHVMSVAEARALFRDVLVDEAKQKAFDAFVSAFQAKWRSRTTCAPAYVWDHDCANWDGTTDG